MHRFFVSTLHFLFHYKMTKVRSCIAIALVFILPILASASAQIPCSDFLVRWTGEGASEGVESRLSTEEIEAAKFLEALSEQSKDDQTGFDQRLNQTTFEQRQLLLKRVVLQKLKKGIAPSEIRALADDLYALALDPAQRRSFLLRLFIGDRPGSIPERLKKQAEIQLLVEDLNSVVDEMELRAQGGRFEKIRQWIQRNDNLYRSLKYAALNQAVFHFFTIPLPVRLPALDLLRTKNNNAEALQLTRKNGFESTYDAWAKFYGIRAKIDSGYEVGRIIYHRLVITYFASLVVSIMPSPSDVIDLYHQMHKKTVQQVQPVQQSQSPEEQFEDWKKVFEILNHRAPDSVLDREEWNQVWRDVHSPATK